MAVNAVQQVFRIRTDATAAQGGTPVWAAAQNTNISLASAVSFRIRFALANTGSTNAGNGVYQLFNSRNAGAYALVPNSAGSNPVYATDATAGASADNSAITTSLLTGASGVFQNGQYDFSGTTAAFILTAGNYTELEFALKFQYPFVGNGDTFDFRIYPGGVPANSYTQTPRVTITQAATQAQVTQAALEEFASAGLSARPQVTQVAMEQWSSASIFIPSHGLVTQVALEQWSSVAIAPPSATQARVMILA